MKKIIVALAIIVLIIVLNNKTEENIIPDEAIRFRIIANSNSIEDQNIKIQIRNEVQNKLLTLISDSKSVEETRKIINENIEDIDMLVKNKLKELNINQKYSINYGNNYFPNKKYKGVTYKNGNYESLVITLGNGDGDNFWCVLFPPLCMMEVNEDDSNEIEYKFAIKEIIDKYIFND